MPVTRSAIGRGHAVPLLLAALAAAFVLGLYFLNSPHAVIEFDSKNSLGTPTYLGAAGDLLRGEIFSTGRLPGYPLVLALLGATTGFYWLVLVLQVVSFFAVVGLTYWISWRALDKRWIAFVIAVLMATDIYAAAYSKEILSESLALTVVTALVAVMVRFVVEPGPSTVWVIAALATITTFTRPEWVFLPLVLAAYFAIWSFRRPLERRTLLHGAAALVVCYLVVGGYIAGNAIFNGYAGTSEINNISLLGKVMQYNMQLEAPPGYRNEAQIIDGYVNGTHLNVWHVVTENPAFAADHYALSGEFGRAVILRDPVKFMRLSLQLALTQNASVDEPLLHVMSGPTRLPLRALAHYTAARYAAFWLLPAFAVMWALYPLVATSRRGLERMGPVAIVALYGTLIVAFGGFDEYGRYHTVFLPASTVLVWGTLLLNVELAARGSGSTGPLVAAVTALELLLIVILALVQSAEMAAIASVVVIVAQAWVLNRSLPAAVPR